MGQNLDGDGAMQPRVGGAKNLAHPARANEGFDLVWAELRQGVHHGLRRLGISLWRVVCSLYTPDQIVTIDRSTPEKRLPRALSPLRANPLTPTHTSKPSAP